MSPYFNYRANTCLPSRKKCYISRNSSISNSPCVELKAYGKFSGTVASGVVEGLNKTVLADGENTSSQEVSDVIQTSAQLYPGDSGGPLFDLSGKVVGINFAISESRSNSSFSIPINDAKSVIAKGTP